MTEPIPRDGDIALIRARWWLHPLTEYDHAALVYSRALTWYSIDAGWTGVRDWPLGQWGRPFVILRPLCDAATSYDAIAWAMTQRGQPYAAWHLPAVFWRMMTKRRKILISADELKPRVCTELVVDAYRAVGLDLTPGVNRPAPDDIYYSEFTEFVGSSNNMEVIE